jgi:hypothetical protein
MPVENHSTANSEREPSMELIIQRIDERLAALGLSDREASMRATGRPDAIREIRRNKRPGSKRIAQLARALDTSPNYLAGYLPHEGGNNWNASTLATSPISGVQELPRDVPVYALTNAGELMVADGTPSDLQLCFIEMERPVDFARRPPRLALQQNIFAARIGTRSLHPRHREGDLAYFDLGSFPRLGDDCLVFFDSTQDQTAPRRVALLEYAGRARPHSTDTRFRQLEPELEYDPPSDLVKRFARMVTLDELLSL